MAAKPLKAGHKVIYAPVKTVNGKVLYAFEHGLMAFEIQVPDDEQQEKKKKTKD